MYRGKQTWLRPLELDDIEKYRQWINDPALLPLVDRVRPVSSIEHRVWYESMINDPCCVIFAIETVVGRRFIGCIWLFGINHRHGNAEVRIIIGDQKYWGRHLGKEVIALLAQFAFKQLNLHKLYAYVLADNARALRSFEQAGFSREGVLKKERYVAGAYVDVVRMGMVKRD